MKTLREVLAQAEHDSIAIRHFNVSNLVAVRASTHIVQLSRSRGEFAQSEPFMGDERGVVWPGYGDEGGGRPPMNCVAWPARRLVLVGISIGATSARAAAP